MHIRIIQLQLMGDRFVPPSVAKKYDFEVPEYAGIDQIVEVSSTGQKL